MENTTVYTYDADGNPASVTDANARTTRYRYNPEGQKTEITRPDGRILATGYDVAGNITSQTDADGTVSRYGYDLLNQPISSQTPPTANNPGGIQSTATYDVAGRLISITDPGTNGGTVTTTRTYNANNFPVTVDWSDPGTPDVSFTYDASGRRRTMTDGTGTSTYSYDSFGQWTSVTDGAGHTVGYAYDLSGNPISLTYPNGLSVDRTLDDAGQLLNVTDWNSKSTSFQYDEDGNLTAINYPNGVRESRTVDRNGAMTAIADTLDGTTLVAYDYTRDSLGQLMTTAPSGATSQVDESYQHTSLKRLSSVTTAAGTDTYGYDPVGNVTALADGSALEYDPAGELTRRTLDTATFTYGYDSRGNRTSVTDGAASRTLNFSQDNRLTGLKVGGQTLASYAYDGNGLRAAKIVGDVRTEFVWDLPSGNLLADGSMHYVYGPNGLLIEQIEDTTSTYVQHDQLNSSRLLTDQAGTIVGSYAYDPYGRTVAHLGMNTSLQYNGQYRDPESGYYYLRARFYDPETAQFLSRDPLQAITLQPYQYAHSTPLDEMDPNGLGCWTRPWECASSPAFQAVKSAASAVSAAAGALAAGSAIVLLAFPETILITGPIVATAGLVSVVGQTVATAIECADGGPREDCVEGVAFTAIGWATLGVGPALAKYYDDYFQVVLSAVGGALEFYANGLQFLRDHAGVEC
jgi:RHS repeat-associated protein